MATDSTTLLDRAKTNRTTIAIAAGCLLAGVLLTKGCAGSSGAQVAPPVPQVLSGPTTTTSTVPAPSIDPLVNLGQLTPTAAALVGPEFDGRRELARRASEA